MSLGHSSCPSDVRMFQLRLKESVLHQVFNQGQKNPCYEEFRKPSFKLCPGQTAKRPLLVAAVYDRRAGVDIFSGGHRPRWRNGFMVTTERGSTSWRRSP